MGTWLHSKYCSGESFARLPSTVDNPDQRMAADVGRWAEELGQLSTVFAAAPLKVRQLCASRSLRATISAAGDCMQLLRLQDDSRHMLHAATGAVLHPLDGAADLRLRRCPRVPLLCGQRRSAEVRVLGNGLGCGATSGCALTHTAALDGAQGTAGAGCSCSVSAGAPGGRPEECACTAACSGLVSRTQQRLGRRACGTAGPCELGPTRKADLPLETRHTVTTQMYLECFGQALQKDATSAGWLTLVHSHAAAVGSSSCKPAAACSMAPGAGDADAVSGLRRRHHRVLLHRPRDIPM